MLIVLVKRLMIKLLPFMKHKIVVEHKLIDGQKYLNNNILFHLN